MIQTIVKDFLNDFLTGSEIESQTLTDFSKELDITIRGWQLIWKFNHHIASESMETEPADVWLAVTTLLIQKMIFSSKAYLMLFLNGFYHNANILLRSMFETAGLLTYIWKNHEAADKWVHEGKVSISTIKLFNVLFDIEGRNPDVNKIYGMLCDDVHSNANTIIQQFYVPDEEDPFFYLKNVTTYDKEIARDKFDFRLAFILLRNLKDKCNSNLADKYKDEIDEYSKDVVEFRRED